MASTSAATQAPREKLSTAEAAAFLGKATFTLHEWRRKHKGPPFYREVGRVFYMLPELRDWVRGNRIEP